MVRLLVGFDPTRAQAAIVDLRSMEGRGVTWRVLNFMNNVNGSAPDQAPAVEEPEPGMWQRLTGWLHHDDADGKQTEQAQPRPPEDLTDAELEALRKSPNRAGMVMLITAPDEEAMEVRKLLLRHGAFSLEPAGSTEPIGSSENAEAS